MKKLLLLLLQSIVIFGCTNENRINHSNTNNIKMQSNSKGDSAFTFSYESDSIIQKAKIIFLLDGKIEFSLSSYNKKTGELAKKQGIAKGEINEDPEIDEDENGNAYPSQQYFFKEKNCHLFFRIDIEERNRLQIKEVYCEEYHSNSCPWQSLGVLRVEKK